MLGEMVESCALSGCRACLVIEVRDGGRDPGVRRPGAGLFFFSVGSHTVGQTCPVGVMPKINETFHVLLDPPFGTSWHKWNRYKLHRGIELVSWHKE